MSQVGSPSTGDGLTLIDDGLGILIVGAHELELVEFEAALVPLNRQVVVVRPDQEPLNTLQEQDFGLIILDVRKAAEDGLALGKAIRKLPRNRSTAIVFITDAPKYDGFVLHASALGVVDFLFEPVHLGLLRAKARMVLQLRSGAVKLRELEVQRDTRELLNVQQEARIARVAAPAAHERAEFLARASALFTSSLDYDTTLRVVASAAVPAVADWCAVDLRDGDDVRSVAVAHADPAKIEHARVLRQKYPPRSDAENGALKVIKSGVPELYAEIPEHVLVAGAQDAEHLRLAKALGLRSAMLVPIKHQNIAIGAITFVIAESERRYTTDDLSMAVQLGEVAGAAISNAKLYDDATTAVRLNELFAGVLGHDLRNPLASIMAATQVLLARDRVPADVGPLKRILSSTERMARMIDELLDFTRIRAGGGIPYEPRPMDLSDTARQVVGESRDSHPTRELRVEEVGDMTGNWDPDRLAQLLSNLVSNAVQHGTEGYPVYVQIDGSADAHVTLRVSNAGTISRDLVPLVFEPFRGSEYKRDRAPGLGLGLYIAKQVALAHGGTIELVPDDTGHTTFLVTLPRYAK